MAGSAAAGQLTATREDVASPALRGDARSLARPIVTSFTTADDAAVRALLRSSIVPGAVRVAFTREPSYLAGESLAGGEDHAVVARIEGRVVGLGRCSVYPLYRNGAPARVGYLGELRVAPGTPHGARLLRAGYEQLADAVGAVDACVTSITTDNARARAVLERGGRLGLPAYTPLATLVTLVAPVPRAQAPLLAPHSPVGPAEWLALVGAHAGATQLSLAWDVGRLHAFGQHGLADDDLVVVRRGTSVVGAAGVWDQRPFRQVVIDGYATSLQLVRPLANAVARLTRRPVLPPSGSVLAQGAILGATVASPSDWPILWPALVARAQTRRLAWLSISRDARDPELAVLRPLLRAREYHTTLYDVALGGRAAVTPWDGARLVRPEVGLL